MNEDFERQMQRFNIIVELGDFSNNHAGPHAVPRHLLDKLSTLNPIEVADLVTFGLTAVARAEELYNQGAAKDKKQNPPNPDVVNAVVIFDKVDAFIRALPCLEEILNHFGHSIAPIIADAIPLEKILVLTVRHMVEDHQFSGRIAKQALAKSERRTQTWVFPWIRDLLINYQPNASA